MVWKKKENSITELKMWTLCVSKTTGLRHMTCGISMPCTCITEQLLPDHSCHGHERTVPS